MLKNYLIGFAIIFLMQGSTLFAQTYNLGISTQNIQWYDSKPELLKSEEVFKTFIGSLFVERVDTSIFYQLSFDFNIASGNKIIKYNRGNTFYEDNYKTNYLTTGASLAIGKVFNYKKIQLRGGFQFTAVRLIKDLSQDQTNQFDSKNILTNSQTNITTNSPYIDYNVTLINSINYYFTKKLAIGLMVRSGIAYTNQSTTESTVYEKLDAINNIKTISEQKQITKAQNITFFYLSPSINIFYNVFSPNSIDKK